LKDLDDIRNPKVWRVEAISMATILIVDDNPVNRQVLVTILGYSGHQLMEASNGEEALASARAQQPDLILSDILMPKMDGFTLVRRLRSEAALWKVPVIFHTAAYLEKEARILAQACGVKYILIKPLEPEVVLKTVYEALQEVAVAMRLPRTGDLQRRHFQLLADKLHQKVSEMERLNAELDARVRQKTAELEAANDRLHSLAVTDELTGLNNRRGFRLLTEELLKLARRSGRSLWLVYADLDYLKRINDTFGHAAGDKALKNVAKILLQTFRESDVVARIGGDEFAILTIDSSRQGFELIQTRVQKNLDAHNHRSNAGYDLSLSMGAISVDLTSIHTVEELLSQADAVMYADKQSKRQER
jgi:diguanylate cyclase (GGDEF)-like protein